MIVLNEAGWIHNVSILCWSLRTEYERAGSEYMGTVVYIVHLQAASGKVHYYCHRQSFREKLNEYQDRCHYLSSW